MVLKINISMNEYIIYNKIMNIY